MDAFEKAFQDEIAFTYVLPDRFRLKGILRTLQTPGSVRNFLATLFPDTEFGPDWLKSCTGHFYHALEAFLAANRVPVVEAPYDVDKAALTRPYYEQATCTEGVVCVLKTQEMVDSFSTRPLQKGKRGGPYTIYRARHRINVYYFYVRDREWGDYNFIRLPTYLPFNVEVNLNGHHWLFRQLTVRHPQVTFTTADNGLATLSDSRLLPALLADLDEAAVRRFCGRWLKQLPHGLTGEQRQSLGDYYWCVHQLEVSLNYVFQCPEVLDAVFEDILLNNQRLGSADRIKIVFDKIVRRGNRNNLSTSIVQEDSRPVLKASYKNHFVKLYNRFRLILRIEVCFNDVRDFVKNKSLSNWARLLAIGRDICQRVIETQHLSSQSVVRRDTLQRLTESEVLPTGQRIPGVRSDAPNLLAVLQAVETLGFQVDGFANAELRQRHQLMTGRAEPLSCEQMSYRLRQLRHKNLIQRIEGQRRYQLTDFGCQAIAFLVKLAEWIQQPVLGACEYGTRATGPASPVAPELDAAYSQLYADLEALAARLGMVLV